MIQISFYHSSTKVLVRLTTAGIKLSAIPGVPLFQFDNAGDDTVAEIPGAANGSKHAKQHDREENGSNDNVSSSGGHSIKDFMRAISGLSENTYKFIDGKFVKQ